MTSLTAKEVLLLNYKLSLQKGLHQGVAEVNVLKAALLRPESTFQGTELYPGVFAKAAALAEFIIRGRPFMSANVSTALAAGLLILTKNGIAIRIQEREISVFERKLESGGISVNELEEWFKSISY